MNDILERMEELTKKIDKIKKILERVDIYFLSTSAVYKAIARKESNNE